jgi:hypothetical protein
VVGVGLEEPGKLLGRQRPDRQAGALVDRRAKLKVVRVVGVEVVVGVERAGVVHSGLLPARRR